MIGCWPCGNDRKELGIGKKSANNGPLLLGADVAKMPHGFKP
jgi:hypothetical protein